MSFRKTLLSASCALLLCSASAAIAADAREVVEGPGKEPLRSERFGTCVHTKWSSPSDPCAPPPAPKPVAAPAPAPEPVTQIAREQLKIYFDFDKSKLTGESVEKLDRIADAVNRSPRVTKVDIVGYTDQIGSDSYNNALSVKRAEETKAYLDTRMRLDSNVTDLRGRGKEDPVADCTGVKARKAKIDCMAKDRRVEIEFQFQK